MTDRPLVAVTGASSGIGAAIAKTFAARGYPLLVTGRRKDRLEALDLPRSVLAAVDVTDGPAMAAAFARAEDEFGPVDLLVNNAGVMPLGSVAEQDPSEWREMFDVNVLALLETARLVLPQMVARRSGTIVNIGSVAGRNIYESHTVYGGTKFAVHAISEGLRKEVAHAGVRVSVVAPGQVATELLDHTTSQDIVDGYRAYTESIGGGLDPVHVANTVLGIYELPQYLCVREVVLAPTAQDA